MSPHVCEETKPKLRARTKQRIEKRLSRDIFKRETREDRDIKWEHKNAAILWLTDKLIWLIVL